ncbi:MAG: hypothetical protein F4Y47_13865, partial [Acidobacteriia bacterium]|nr:hypothetical protein [Terriglobia bacterium]
MPTLLGLFALFSAAVLGIAETAVPVDLDDYRDGPVSAEVSDELLVVTWQDSSGDTWQASFNRDPSEPLLESVGSGDMHVLREARPFYRVDTGVRSKGWNAFFDYPPA